MNRDIVHERKVFPEGAVIFKAGDEGRCAYLIQEGRVEMSVPTPGGGKNVLGVLGAQSLFGEMALIDGRPRMATATTLEPTVVVIIGRSMFEEKLKKADPFIRALLNVAMRHIRDMSGRMT